MIDIFENSLTEISPSHWTTTANNTIKRVCICDTQPVTIEGIRTLLSGCPDLALVDTTDSLNRALDLVRRTPFDVLMLDKAFGVQPILDWLENLKSPIHFLSDPAINMSMSIIIWGVALTEAEALRFLQAGARGILRKTSGISTVLSCLRTVAAGRSWLEDCVFRDSARMERYSSPELTIREQQVLQLVERGFKNREIGQELGIAPGTVKIHLKHIFEKTGVRGRYGLTLSNLTNRGSISFPFEWNAS